MKIAAVAFLSIMSAAAAFAAEPLRAPVASPIAVSPSDPVVPTKPGAGDDPRSRTEATKSRADVVRKNDPPRGRLCFNAADTRENITVHRLTEPFRALRAGRLQGEALRARLCRWKPDEFVYEVSVLRPSGRIAHVYMNARSGQAVGALDDNDRN